MIDNHVHCGSCRQVILTEIKVRGGKTKPAEITIGTELVLAKGPSGPVTVERPVPLCQACADQVAKQQAELARRSKIIVPVPDLKPAS